MLAATPSYIRPSPTHPSKCTRSKPGVVARLTVPCIGLLVMLVLPLNSSSYRSYSGRITLMEIHFHTQPSLRNEIIYSIYLPNIGQFNLPWLGFNTGPDADNHKTQQWKYLRSLSSLSDQRFHWFTIRDQLRVRLWRIHNYMFERSV